MGLKESGLRGSLRSTSSVLPAFFDVTITNTNSPVQEGDILAVDYSADNTGDAQDTQDIRLEIDSVEEDRDSDITLLGAQSTTGTLEWDTTDEDETTYTATVLSDDDTDSVTVEIEAAIPDSVETQYEYEDDSDTTVAIDSIGSNDADINGPTYDPDAARGSFALLHDGDDDFTVSQSTINLASAGTNEEVGLGGFLKSDGSGDDSAGAINWATANGTTLRIQENSGTWQAGIFTDGSGGQVDSGVSISTSEFQHVWVNADDTEVWILVDGAEQARTTHGITPSNIGSGVLATGRTNATSSLAYGGLVDNASYATATLEESEVQSLI